jgi:hypothetical protein
MAGLIIMSFVGGLFLFLGFLIWKSKMVGLIAGYDPEKVKEPEKLAEWMGKCLMVHGLVAWLIGGIGYEFETKKSGLILMVIFMVLSSLGMAITLAGIQRFLK